MVLRKYSIEIQMKNVKKIDISRKVINRLGWIREDFYWGIINYFSCRFISERPVSLTIGITTFLDRFDNCFKPLLKRINFLFPDCQIIVVANGHVKKAEQVLYLLKINDYCKKYSNVKLIDYKEPKGLSFIWNRIIESAKDEIILILNDDLKIKTNFRKFITNSGLIDAKIALINKSWSHFMISKTVYKKIGPFDEGLLEIGGEDDDYSARLAMAGQNINYFLTDVIAPKLRNKKKKLRINSYGRNMNEERHGYSTYNAKYLEAKWETSSINFEGATNVPNRSIPYWKLRR